MFQSVSDFFPYQTGRKPSTLRIDRYNFASMRAESSKFQIPSAEYIMFWLRIVLSLFFLCTLYSVLCTRDLFVLHRLHHKLPPRLLYLTCDSQDSTFSCSMGDNVGLVKPNEFDLTRAIAQNYLLHIEIAPNISGLRR